MSYSEKLGDSKIRLMWQSDSQPFEVINQEQLYSQLNSGKTPYLFRVVPASTNQTTSTLETVESAYLARVNVEETHFI